MRRFLAVCTWLAGIGLAAAVAGAAALWMYLAPQLPSVESLRDVRLQVPLQVYTRDGRLMAEFGEQRRRPLRLEDVPEALRVAILATEDEHFLDHPGVDWRGIARALLYLVRTGEKGPGGSTITMQVARNFFLGREKTYFRKLNEILLALNIERELSKDEILELYVNKIFLGHRAYGVAVAAEVYYGRPLEELSVPELAMIAGLPQRPSELNPITNPERGRARRNHVLNRMREVGYLDQAAYEAASRAPITAILHAPVVEHEAPYVAEMIRQQAEETFGAGAYTDAYRVYSTIDSRLQEAAIRALRQTLMEYDRRHGYRGPERRFELGAAPSAAELEERLRDTTSVGGLIPAVVTRVGERDATLHVRNLGAVVLAWDAIAWARPHIDEDRLGRAPKKAADVLAAGDLVRVKLEEDGWQLAQIPAVEGALVALDPEDGAILAMGGGYDFFRSKFNRAAQARRQPGSSFKPFVYAAALARGFTAASLINDAPVVFDDPGLETVWRPENYSGKFFGPTRLRVALAKSRNLVSIRLLRAIGLDFALDYIRRFGFDAERLPRNLSLALGSGGVTPLEAATGYSILANGGFAVRPWLVERILDRGDEEVVSTRPARVCRDCDPSGAREEGADIAPRVVPATDIWILQSMLRDVVRYGTARRAGRELGRTDLAGKTGTTNDQRDAWFCGFVPGLVAVVWVGFDDHHPLGAREVGGRAALPMWLKFMRTALAGIPESLPPPPDGLVTVRIDPETGTLSDASDPDAVFEAFRAAYLPAGGSGLRAPADSGQASGATERLF